MIKASLPFCHLVDLLRRKGFSPKVQLGYTSRETPVLPKGIKTLHDSQVAGASSSDLFTDCVLEGPYNRSTLLGASNEMSYTATRVKRERVIIL